MSIADVGAAARPPRTAVLLPEQRRALLAYGAAVALGFAHVAYLFPLGYLLGSVDLARPPLDDMAQNVVVQRYFFADAWRWPLLVAANLVGPAGTNLGLLDGIPLVALPAKLLAPLLPPAFHAVNLWYAIAWLLQPVAAVWCLRGAGERRLLPALAVAVAAASMPVWWNRFGHASLTGQFILLLALGAYLRLVRRQSARRWTGALLLELAALLVQPYLALMVLAVLAAVPLTLRLRREPGWRPAALGVAALLLAQLLGLAFLGYLGVTGGQGFGRFKMDLLGPIWPHDSALFPWTVGEINPWEGYNYLGAGLLFGLAFVLVARAAAVRAAIRRHAGLALVLAGLALFALSQRPTFASQLLLDPGAVADWLENFRSTGRFFWPVAYALLVGAVVLVARHPDTRLAAAALVALAALQFADAGVLRERVRAAVAEPRGRWSVDAPALRALLAQAESVTLLPTWYCAPHPDPQQDQNLLLEVLLLASERGVPASTMDVPRWRGDLTCADKRLAAAPLGRGELRVLTPRAQASYLALVPRSTELCAPAGSVVVCRDPASTVPAPTEPPRPAPLRLGAAFGFSALDASGMALLGRGWSDPEADGTWSFGDRAELFVARPPGAGREGLALRLDLVGFAPADDVPQEVEVAVAGQAVAAWSLPDRQPQRRTLELPPGPPGTVAIELRVRSPARPVDRGLNPDDRRLGVQLRAMRVDPAPERPALPLEKIAFGPGSAGASALGQGWAEPEPAGTWSNGRRAELVLTRPEGLAGPLRLRLRLEALAPAPEARQRVGLWLDGREVASWKLEDRRPAWVEAGLPAGPPGPMRLELRVGTPIRPVDRGIGTDTRELGVQIQGLRAKPAGWWAGLF